MKKVLRFTHRSTTAQAMVEFMLALPLLLLVIYGTIELARLAFMFTSTSNASRSAARYGSGSGENADGTPHYMDCDGIKEVAKQSAFISDFTKINITYDRGVNPDGTQIPIAGIDPSPSKDSCPVDNLNVRNGDRIIVQVSTTYKPIVPIVPIKPLEIVSSSARTFIVSIPILGSSVPLGFAAETSTPSRVPTNSNPATLTPTVAFVTSTRLPASVLTQLALPPTNTLPPTITYTPSKTPLPTYTPTITPTPIMCTGPTSGVTHGPLTVKDNYIEMSILNNTGFNLVTSEIYIEWNHDTGHIGENRSLHLRQITLDNKQWDGDLFAPLEYIRGFHPFIPVNQSTIRFVFDQKYDVTDGTERIIISLGTPGCVDYPIDSSH
ncbi:MAG: TadE/TadG family type IV pilus assembly protein [Anaerolineales bacterium]